jgi:hypothetical protein
MSREDRKVRVLIDKDGVLIRAGDPTYSTKSINKEILQVIRDGGQVKNITYEEYLGMKLYQKNDTIC